MTIDRMSAVALLFLVLANLGYSARSEEEGYRRCEDVSITQCMSVNIRCKCVHSNTTSICLWVNAFARCDCGHIGGC